MTLLIASIILILKSTVIRNFGRCCLSQIDAVNRSRNGLYDFFPQRICLEYLNHAAIIRMVLQLLKTKTNRTALSNILINLRVVSDFVTQKYFFLYFSEFQITVAFYFYTFCLYLNTIFSVCPHNSTFFKGVKLFFFFD